MTNNICQICKRETPDGLMENHHLIPRSLSKRKKFVKWFKNRDNLVTIKSCRSCSDQVHQLFTEKELAENYNTPEKLLANEKIQEWIKWIRKKPNDFSVCMKSKKKK